MMKFKRILCLLLVISLIAAMSITAFSSEYTVVSGDSLWAIANRFGITVDELMEANNLKTERLQLGQVLKIPDGKSSGGNDTPATNDPPVDAPSTPGLEIPTLTVDFIDAISFDVRDTDIRDVLNIIAKYSGKKIIYFGQSQNITLSCSLVSSIKAISLIVEKAKNLTYLTDGDVILVGPKSRLTAMFLYTDISKELSLVNMTASDFVKVINDLGINTSAVNADETNPNKLTVSATPRNMAYVVNTLTMVDKDVNFPVDELTQKELLNMKAITLNSIDESLLRAFINAYSLRLSIIPHYLEGDNRIFVTGSMGATNDLEALLKKLDTPANAEESTRVSVYKYPVKGDDRDAFVTKLKAKNPPSFIFVTTEGNKKTIYLAGTEEQIKQTAKIADSLQ